MSTSSGTTSVPSKADISEAYQKLTSETGDLYFQLEHARETLKLLEARMEVLRKQRNTLNEAYQRAIKEETADGATMEPEAGG